jgi:effector-binding domain-containing protein
MEGLMELEFGVPITTDIEATGEFFIGELPAGRYATITHTGSYDELYDVTALLVGWAKERGVEWDSEPAGAGERFVSRVETYLNDPGETPEDQLVTRLDFKVR